MAKKTETRSRAAAIYLRLSLDRYNDNLGIDRQKEACLERANQMNLDLLGVFADNSMSASTGKARPEFNRMMAAVNAGQVGAIIAWAPDRLTRHPREFQDFLEAVEANKVDVVTIAQGSVDFSTPAGRANARVISAFSILETEQKGQRQVAANDQRAAQGRPPSGQVPFGFRRDPKTGAYEAVRSEAREINKMVSAVTQGISLSRIAADLNARGVPTRRSASGGKWASSSVSRVVKNPAIAGLRVHRRKIVGDAAWDAIVPADEWRTAVATLEDPHRKRAHAREDGYWLSGLLRAADGTPLFGDRDNKGEVRRRIYRPKAKTPDFVLVSADAIEELVAEAVLQRLDHASLLPPRVDYDVDHEAASLEQDLAELRAARSAKRIELEDFIELAAPIRERLEVIRASVPSAGVAEPLLNQPGAARIAWPALGTEARRRLVRSVVDHVELRRADRGRHTPLLDRVDMVYKA